MCQQPTVEFVGFPSIFIFDGSSVELHTWAVIGRGDDDPYGESGIERGERAAIERKLTGGPRESALSTEHLQAWDAGLEGG
jgi:hypothetical protein